MFLWGLGLGDACGAPGRFHNIHVRINGSAYLIPLTMIVIWLRTNDQCGTIFVLVKELGILSQIRCKH